MAGAIVLALGRESAHEFADVKWPRMPQVSAQEFELLPLRVHSFLAGVPLHDVWAVDLPLWRSGITLDDFLRAASNRLFTPSPLVRILLDIRLFVGRLLGWDREPPATALETFATRLTPADRSKSLAAAGTREGLFRVVYRFENEQLLEVINRTAHRHHGKLTCNCFSGYFAMPLTLFPPADCPFVMLTRSPTQGGMHFPYGRFQSGRTVAACLRARAHPDPGDGSWLHVW